MNPQTAEQNNAPPVTPAPKNKPKAKAKPARAPRKIDPGIAAIRKEASDKIVELRRARASRRLLKTILDKRLAQLTENDKQQLFDYLQHIVTPSLQPTP